MTDFWWITPLFVGLIVLDAVAYGAAKCPERMRKIRYLLPGGGFLALWQLGRDR